VSDSYYCIEPVASKRLTSRTYARLEMVKKDNDLPSDLKYILYTIFFDDASHYNGRFCRNGTPAHRNADNPVIKGKAVTDRLAARVRSSCRELLSSRLPYIVPQERRDRLTCRPGFLWGQANSR